MNMYRSLTRGLLGALLIGATALPSAWAADLPKATQKMLKKLKMDASVLKGLDKELAVPKAWVDAARKEGKVRVYTTMRPKAWKKMQGIVKERFPYINVIHSDVRTATRRWVRPLAAYKEGRLVTDVIMDMSGSIFQFREANAVIPLNDLPGYGNFPAFARLPDHLTVAVRSRYWCMGYNTKLVKKADLPKTWEDVVASKRFSGKRLALANRANLWLLNLWDQKGSTWGKDYTNKLFALSPQLRKEGLTGVLKLVGLGEAQAVLPAAMNRVGPLAKKGMPIAHHCPEPVPFTVSDMAIMNKSPHTNAAKIFVNWFISKEGQIAQFWANASTPSHKEFYQNKQFIFYPEQVAGKKMAVLGPDSPKTAKALTRFWNAEWQAKGGPKRKSRKKKKKAKKQ
jgi:ABC-type Fe3+ transport system substrate-binding protein